MTKIVTKFKTPDRGINKSDLTVNIRKRMNEVYDTLIPHNSASTDRYYGWADYYKD